MGAGMLLRDLLTLLAANNMSLPVLSTPIYATLALDAAVASEAHGTNLDGPSVFADNVVNATWVDGTGAVRSGSNLSTVAGAIGLTGVCVCVGGGACCAAVCSVGPCSVEPCEQLVHAQRACD